jgi:hypothetical protein
MPPSPLLGRSTTLFGLWHHLVFVVIVPYLTLPLIVVLDTLLYLGVVLKEVLIGVEVSEILYGFLTVNSGTCIFLIDQELSFLISNTCG